jgi:NAD(P)H-dependent flavin oxidoreductase YrpB (nitropropane dioxygenase family)
MLKTRLCQLLGIDHPVLSAGMALAAGPALAAAVSNAGGCGVIGGGGNGEAYVRDVVARTRALTDRPFGLNVILGDQEDDEDIRLIDAFLELGLPVLVFFWGNPGRFVERAHRKGTKVLMQVGSVDEARRAAATGVDAIIAQGAEAGGHVRGTTALSVLVPEVVDAVKPVPVIASGGIADGRGLAAALALGAEGVSLGTRFVASQEFSTPPGYKEAVVAAKAADTVYSEFLFDVGWPDAPHRVIRNQVVREWEAAGRPPSGKRPGEGTIIGRRTGAYPSEIQRYRSTTPTEEFVGDVELLPFWAGQSCSLVSDVKSAGDIVRDLVREAEEVIERMQGMVAVPEKARR